MDVVLVKDHSARVQPLLQTSISANRTIRAPVDIAPDLGA